MYFVCFGQEWLAKRKIGIYQAGPAKNYWKDCVEFLSQCPLCPQCHTWITKKFPANLTKQRHCLHYSQEKLFLNTTQGGRKQVTPISDTTSRNIRTLRLVVSDITSPTQYAFASFKMARLILLFTNPTLSVYQLYRSENDHFCSPLPTSKERSAFGQCLKSNLFGTPAGPFTER